MLVRYIVVSLCLILLSPAVNLATPRQCNDHLCGPNCLSYIFKQLGVETDLEEILRLTGFDNKPLSLLNIRDAAKAKGLQAVGMKISADEIAATDILCIAHLQPDHFVVVQPANNSQLMIVDSPSEPVVVSIETFDRYYSGFAVLITKNANALPTPHASGPDLRLEEYTHNFGFADEGEMVKFSIPLHNAGNEELVISKVEPSCSCTVPTIRDLRIAPGKDTEMMVILDTSGRRGPQSLSIKLYSNDSIVPVSMLTITGGVRADRLAMSYRRLDLGTIKFEDTIQKEIYVPASTSSTLNYSDKPLQLLEVSSDVPWLSTSVKKSESEDKPGDIIVVTAKPQKAGGELTGNIRVTTNHPKEPNVQIPVVVKVKPVIDVNPAEVFFGVAHKGQDVVKELSISTDPQRKLVVDEVDALPDYLTVSIDKKSANECKLMATLKSNAPVGNLKTEIKLHTDDPDQPLISIPVYAVLED